MKRAAAFVENLDLSRLELPVTRNVAGRSTKAIKLISWLAEMDSASALVKSAVRSIL